MAYRLYFYSPTGREWRLLHEDPNGVFVHEDGLVEGLMGARTDNPVTAVGRSGQRASTADAQVNPIAFSLPCTVAERYCGGSSPEEVWLAFRADWNACTFENPGTVVLDNDEGAGRLVLPARLNGSLPGPSINPSELDEIAITVPVIGDHGRWLQAFSDTGIVTVTNNGVGDTYPRIRWVGAGGDVVLPSTSTITLPPVDEERVLLLDPAESYAVLDADGALDDPLWRQVRDHVLGESVPEKQTRTYQLPPEATLEYDLGYLDPWR